MMILTFALFFFQGVSVGISSALDTRQREIVILDHTIINSKQAHTDGHKLTKTHFIYSRHRRMYNRDRQLSRGCQLHKH